MKQSDKFLSGLAAGCALLGAAFLGQYVRGLVDVGRWPLTAQRPEPALKIDGDRLPIATDPGYVRGSEAEYFYAVADLIRREYVDPVEMTEAMAVGAVKGLVASLSDPSSRFFDKDTYPSFLARERGEIEGAGVEVTLEYDKEGITKLQQKKRVDPLTLLPRVVVSCVYPGSSAEAKGLRPGDQVTRLNGKYVLSSDDIRALRDLQEKVSAKQADSASLATLQKELQMKAKEAMSASRARDLLYRREAQPVRVEWKRDGQPLAAELESRTVRVTPLQVQSDRTYHLRFVSGAAEAFKNQRPPDGAVIDLRNSGHGNFNTMRQCLMLLCPKGSVGELVTERGRSPMTNPSAGKPPSHWTLRTDATTVGAAAVFAKTLASLQLAKLEGEPGGGMDWVEAVDVNGQSGYTLVTGRFEPAKLSGEVAK